MPRVAPPTVLPATGLQPHNGYTRHDRHSNQPQPGGGHCPSAAGERLFAGIAWEQQFYGTDSYLANAIDPETLGDVSLAGPVFTIGFDR